MTEQPLDQIAETRQIVCRGVDMHKFRSDSKIEPVPTPLIEHRDKMETVIVKIYQSGKTEPLCRYLSNGMCNAVYWLKGGGEEAEMKGRGNCIYVSNPQNKEITELVREK